MATTYHLAQKILQKLGKVLGLRKKEGVKSSTKFSITIQHEGVIIVLTENTKGLSIKHERDGAIFQESYCPTYFLNIGLPYIYEGIGKECGWSYINQNSPKKDSIS